MYYKYIFFLVNKKKIGYRALRPMKVTIKNEPKSEILMSIALEATDMAPHEDKAAKYFAEKVEVKGFRPGTAPKFAVITSVGAERFEEEVIRIALMMSYSQAVREQKIQVISRPEITIKEKRPLMYEARVAVLPKVSIEHVEKISIPKNDVTVSDEEVMNLVDQYRKYRASYAALTRPIAKGDRVEIDFQGFDESGKAIEAMKSTNHPLFLGEGQLVEDFERQLVGMSIGEKKRISVVFPNEYHHKPSAGKKFHFDVDIKRGDSAILPELSEDWIHKETGKKQTISEFHGNVRQDILREKQREERARRESELLEIFLKNAKLDVPPVLLREEVEFLFKDLAAQLEEKKIPFEKYEEHLKKKGKDIKNEYEAEADKRIRIRLLLSHLFAELKLTVTPDEIGPASKAYLDTVPEEHRANEEKLISEQQGRYPEIVNSIRLKKLFIKYLGEES